MTVRPSSLLVSYRLLVILRCAHCNVLAQEKVLSCVPHLHLHGSGAWFRHCSSMMDAAAIQALVDARVAQVLAATAATRDNAGGSSGSVQIHKHYARLEKLVPEDWKEWHYQFGVATHAYCSKNGLLLEIVERMELDEVSTEALNHQMTQEQQDWMGENAVRDVQRAELADQG